jgi:hypothetical protein
VEAVNIDLPSLLPLDCLFGGINFAHNLVMMTSGPLLVILGLETLAKALRKCDAASAAKVAALEAAALKASPKKRRRRKSKDAEAAKPQSTFLLLAELCSDLSFFIIFLLCTHIRRSPSSVLDASLPYSAHANQRPLHASRCWQTLAPPPRFSTRCSARSLMVRARTTRAFSQRTTPLIATR